MTPDQPSYKVSLPPEIVKYISKDAPKNARLLAARGMVPMAPAVQMTVLFFLSNDAEPDVAKAAKDNLLSLPREMLQKTLAEPTHPKILDFFARNKVADEALIEIVLLNPLTPDESLIFLADQLSEKNVLLIANNQQRLLKNSEIAAALRKNERAPQAVIDRMLSFLRINGIVLEGERAELNSNEVQMIMDMADTEEEEFPEDLMLDSESFTEEDNRRITQKISTMTVAEKVKLALVGNKEVRTLLIKDSNKVVATAVVKSPQIKESEIINIAQMRSVNDDVIRIIAHNPDWTKMYPIQLALCKNPKTPLLISMRFVKLLRVKDLAGIAKTKSVPSALSKMAKEMWDKKRV